MRTEGEYDEAAEWTEWAKSRMRLRPGGSSTDLRGVDAAAFGADLIERSKGGRPRRHRVGCVDRPDLTWPDLARAGSGARVGGQLGEGVSAGGVVTAPRRRVLSPNSAYSGHQVMALVPSITAART